MRPDGERLATLEEQVRDFERDMGVVTTELGSHRRRLHDLEGIAGTFVNLQKEARRKEAEQYQRLGVRIQILSVVVALAAIVAPIITVIALGK